MRAACRFRLTDEDEPYCNLRSSHISDDVRTLIFQGRNEFVPVRCDRKLFSACPFKMSDEGSAMNERGTVPCEHCGKRHVPGSLNQITCREWHGFRTAMQAQRRSGHKVRTGSTVPVYSEDCDEGVRRQLWPRVQVSILRRDRFTCQQCGRNYREIERKRNGRAALEVHHIIPRSMGGTEHPDNLITLCRSCHAAFTRDGMAQLSSIKRREKELLELNLANFIHSIEDDENGSNTSDLGLE